MALSTVVYARAFEAAGFAVIRQLVHEEALSALEQALAHDRHESSLQRGGDIYGLRNLLAMDPIRAFVGSGAVAEVIEPILGVGAGAVRGIFFDKTPGANWNLRWHRDWAIAVKERIETPEYSAWSMKAGVPHVYPPVEILQTMVALRVHLDACDASNGALKVIPGSHKRLDVHEDALRDYALEADVVVCDAQRGDAVLMRPLIAHSSDKSSAPSHRRVIHIEFASQALPPPLQWHEFVRRSSSHGSAQ